MPASCTGMKMPANWWFCRSSIRATISAFPTAKPSRQPAMPYDFDIEKSSKPTSRAPSTARKLAGLRPSKTRSPYAKSCITHAPARCAHAIASSKTPSGAHAATGFDG